MIKKIILSIVMLSVILFGMTNVNAANGSANLIASSTSVKAGETFTVTLSVNCEDGVNGVDTTYSYDEDKLELVSANVAGNNWANLGVNGTIQVICNSTSKITSDNVYVLTFKVKDNAQVGSTAKISTTDIKIDSDVTSSSFTETAKTVNVNIISENSDNSNNGNNNQSSNNQDTNNNENQQSDITNNNNNGEQGSDISTNSGSETSGTTNNNNNQSQLIDTSSKSTSQKSDNSTSNKVLPKTGKSSKILIMSIIVVSALAIVLYIKIKNKI